MAVHGDGGIHGNQPLFVSPAFVEKEILLSCTLVCVCVYSTGAALTGAESQELQEVLEETNVSITLYAAVIVLHNYTYVF